MESEQAATKSLIVVGGPNGSGKTTFVQAFLSQRSCTYLSADAIAAELSPADPAANQIHAGRLLLERLSAHIEHSEECLLVESTLSGKTLRHWIRRAASLGFSISIVFLFLDSAEACIVRVNERVRKGGHAVPEADIRRRFRRSIRNFWRIYREIADDWMLYYNAGNDSQKVAFGVRERYSIRADELFREFLRQVGDDADD